MQRLLAILQLTRAALAFTAVADAWAFLLLRAPGAPRPSHLVARLLLAAFVAVCLYGFGMSLNDLLDARRDRVFARWRPIPSGRLSPRAAIVIALSLLLGAMFGAGVLEAVIARSFVPLSPLVVFAAAALIVFYNATGKHLGGAGLLTLGAIRAVACFAGHPAQPMIVLSAFLLTHVALAGTVAYRLEGKRPRLKRNDLLIVFAGVFAGDLLILLYMWWRGDFDGGGGVWHQWHMLVGPLAAMALYGLWMLYVLARDLPPRKKGEWIMLAALFWLFAYDASILFANGQWKAGLAILLLAGLGMAGFVGMRAWSRAWAAKPRYRITRAGV